jgi:hypothetical protein
MTDVQAANTYHITKHEFNKICWSIKFIWNTFSIQRKRIIHDAGGTTEAVDY